MKYIDTEKLVSELTKMQFTLNAAYRKPQSDNIVRAISLEYDDILSLIESLQQEQTEVPNGKFVFPKYLYARTKDNKTIDMSYAPQDMNAIEYIRNDFIQQEQPEVDLEKAFESYLNNMIGQPRMWHPNEQIEWGKSIARHFAEWGAIHLNARTEQSKVDTKMRTCDKLEMEKLYGEE